VLLLDRAAASWDVSRIVETDAVEELVGALVVVEGLGLEFDGRVSGLSELPDDSETVSGLSTLLLLRRAVRPPASPAMTAMSKTATARMV
jgi:hypothetical protein